MTGIHVCYPWTRIATATLFLCGCGMSNLSHLTTDHGEVTSIVSTQVKAEDATTRTFNIGPKPKVTVEVFLGAIEIVAGKDDAIQATVTIRAGAATKDEAEKALKEVSLTFDETIDSLRIIAAPPQGKQFSGNASARLEVPAGASLELKTNLAGIMVTGIHGDIRANDSQGPIIIKDALGVQDLSTTLAAIELEGACDKVIAKNSQGRIVVHGATGIVDLTTSLNLIELIGPTTQAKITNSQGRIVVHEAKGELDLTTSLASIEVDAPCTTVTAQNSQGEITVFGAKGPLKLATSLAAIVVKGAENGVTADNSQGNISIHDAKGQIKARTCLAQIDVEATDAVVDAQNSQGGVNFRGSLTSGNHAVRTSQGNVTLTLPSAASFQIDATVKLGSITNSFPLSKTQKSSATKLVGTVGTDPESSILVNVHEGSVTVREGT